MLITPSFKKSLIVEQFQGNYLKAFPVVINFTFLFCIIIYSTVLYNFVFFLTNCSQSLPDEINCNIIGPLWFRFAQGLIGYVGNVIKFLEAHVIFRCQGLVEGIQ